jgi:hypothetical protein
MRMNLQAKFQNPEHREARKLELQSCILINILLSFFPNKLKRIEIKLIFIILVYKHIPAVSDRTIAHKQLKSKLNSLLMT